MRLLPISCALATAFALAGTALAQVADSPTAVVHGKARGVRVIQPDAPADGGGSAAAPVKSAPMAPVAHSIMKPCERPVAKADFVLGETKHFDWELSHALKDGKTVVVDLAQPYDQKEPPPAALSPWLSEVKGGGGVVTVSPYCLGGRGIAHNWLLDFVQHVTGGIYKPARNYDATLYADATHRKVTFVEFKPKGAAVASR